MKVSVYNQCKYYSGDTYTSEVIEAIKNGKVKEEVIALRQLLAEGKSKEYSTLKKNLPGFTVSGTFPNRRLAENLQDYNGNIVIDVDQLSPILVEQAAERAKQSPYTYTCFISPSNEGIKIICKTNATKETHKSVYDDLKNYFEEWLNLFIDTSGKDIQRLCLYSYDPNAYINQEAEIFNSQNLKPMQTQKEIKDPQAVFEHCKRYTDKKKNYTQGNRNNYIYLLANNCNRKGLTEEQCLNYTCAEFNLDNEETKLTINSAYNNRGQHNTDKIKEDKENLNNITIIEEYLTERYNFRYNEVTGKIEFKKKADFLFIPMTDYLENSLFRELLKANIKCNISKLRSILCSDFCPTFDPFTNYFKALPPWDGETDYIQQLASTITTTQTELWKTCFRKWIVAMVGTCTDAKTINHTVIVFSGKQGIGKTTWMENLVPLQLKEHLYSGTINPDNKDTLIHLSECMLINLDELENLNKSEIGSLKELITKTFIKLRRAYGHNNERMNRRASFAGSVNTIQFLNDTTGSRRFLCFEVLDIDYQHKIDINLVLAQALHLFKQGFVYWFTKAEIAEITNNNEQYQVKTVEEELLLTYFQIPTDKYNITYLTASQIASKIAEKTKTNVTNANAISLGKILHKYGFKKVKKCNRYVYELKELDYEAIERNSKEPDAILESNPVTLSKKEEENLPF
jgi:predicted P-loop ATPase